MTISKVTLSIFGVSYIRSKTNVKENVLRVKKQNVLMTENDVETANEINRAFQSVFVGENV